MSLECKRSPQEIDQSLAGLIYSPKAFESRLEQLSENSLQDLFNNVHVQRGVKCVPWPATCTCTSACALVIGSAFNLSLMR